jgi:hypothetical protein
MRTPSKEVTNCREAGNHPRKQVGQTSKIWAGNLENMVGQAQTYGNIPD